MGKRKRDRQPAMWATTTDLPTAASHPFYRRLNQLLREHGFDDFVEAQCAGFYAATMGRPGLPPGVFADRWEFVRKNRAARTAKAKSDRKMTGNFLLACRLFEEIFGFAKERMVGTTGFEPVASCV